MHAARELGLTWKEEWNGPRSHPGCVHGLEHGDPDKANQVSVPFKVISKHFVPRSISIQALMLALMLYQDFIPSVAG